MSGGEGAGWAWWDSLADAARPTGGSPTDRPAPGEADVWPLQPVVHRVVLTELCSRYGPAGCICHLDRGHLGGAGGAELLHDCGHCQWPDEQSASGFEADARLVFNATAAGVPGAEIRDALLIGPADGRAGYVEIDLSDRGPL